MLFSLIWFCVHAFTDCQPTLIPLRGSKVYVLDGSNSYDLTWNYNTDGRTIKEVQLKYSGTGNADITVAGRTPTGQLQVNPGSGYSASRISYSGSNRYQEMLDSSLSVYPTLLKVTTGYLNVTYLSTHLIPLIYKALLNL